MAKRQNFVVGSTNPNTQSRTTTQLNNAWNQFEVLRSGVLDGVFNAVSDYSNDSSNEIANAIVELTGSQPTGATQTELAEALHKMREDIETSSLTFVGYISSTQPSSSDYDFQVGNIWIQSATLPTSFPVAIAGIWDGTQWANTADTYTQKDFDFFRDINDGEGYYWFGGEWKVMSTDMSTTYFTLNQTSGKWEIKHSVNLPGAPTVATPTSASPQTQIANKRYVDEAIGGSGTGRNVGDVFFTMRSDNSLNGAVNCDGSIYDTTDFTGGQSIGALLKAGNIPYVSLANYATALATNGSVGIFGWDGTGTTTFRVPSLNDIFVETGTAAQIGDFLAAGAPNITGTIQVQRASANNTATDAFYITNTNTTSDRASAQSAQKLVGFDASRSNTIYGNSSTIQPKAVRYRAMVQLAIAASDVALETCTSVLSDVAALNTHRVIAFQAPTAANGYTWYRKYADGWVEQGGVVPAPGSKTVNTQVVLPIVMADNNYTITTNTTQDSAYSNDTTNATNNYATNRGAVTNRISTTGFYINFMLSESVMWEVKGMAAS